MRVQTVSKKDEALNMGIGTLGLIDDLTIIYFAGTLHSIAMISLNSPPSEIARGHPCFELIYRGLIYGARTLAVEILTRKRKYSLNGKDYNLVVSVSEEGKLKVVLTGEQVALYPITSQRIREKLNERGY